MKNEYGYAERRALKCMPFAKMFETENGNREFCNPTGYEACFGDPKELADWWNEYADLEGNLYYGR